ncbi:MAG: hypothetical protein FWD14_03475 [Treponema sp.]|nr:hypothetical protein [Treponema sp.]
MPEHIKIKALRDKIAASKASKAAIAPFMASVEFDMGRQKPIGIKNLFIHWLEKGNKYWLNPMDKTGGVGALEEILFKYQGDINVLQPFIQLLTQLAEAGISPRAFTEYVLLPRMRQDYNWRNWKENHLEALQIIAKLLITAKEHPPFNHEHIGVGRTKLARDIVLVRYIGRPLALYPLVQLSDEEKLRHYEEIWQKISLKDPLCLYFMRNNALQFVYIMSGKIDLIQLVAIVEQLPEIELAFEAVVNNKNINLKNIKAMNLYDSDINTAILSRKSAGYYSLDFAIEIKAFFNIVKALIKKSTGVYLCAFYAKLLKKYLNPVIAEMIYNLVCVIEDSGGMYIYKWHTNKLLGFSKTNMQKYLQFLKDHNGCDPLYPRGQLLFRDEDAAKESIAAAKLAEELGLCDTFLKNKTNISYKDLLFAYINKYPDNREIIEKFQNNMLSGTDRLWNKEFIKQLDILGSEKRSLHGLLLRSIIRGIGSGYSRVRSFCFEDVFNKYGIVNTLPALNVRTVFQMPIVPIGQSTCEKDKFARKQINLINIEKVWNALCETDPLNADYTLSFIDSWIAELTEPFDKAFKRKISCEKDLQKMQQIPDDDEIKEKLKKDITKQNKIISTLINKKKHYIKIIKEFNSLNDLQKFTTALILAGSKDNSTDDISYYAAALLLYKYKHLESISSRMNFLKEDVSIDVISYQQLLYLLNLLETLFIELREDKEIIVLLKTDTVLQEILEPYIVTKKKKITMDALDAAAKKITSFASLLAERAKWQRILVSLEEKNEKYYHNMEIYTSKTFMDSYYGDMGGICLSSWPFEILRPGFYIQRFVDLTDRQIIGMSIIGFSKGGFSCSKTRANKYIHVFGFNPLFSFIRNFTDEQLFNLYLQFRLNLEKIAWETKLPVVLSGIDSKTGLISNNLYFETLIKVFESNMPSAIKVKNAKGFSMYYHPREYQRALLIIDPRGCENIKDLSAIPTFIAHRQLAIIS